MPLVLHYPPAPPSYLPLQEPYDFPWHHAKYVLLISPPGAPLSPASIADRSLSALASPSGAASAFTVRFRPSPTLDLWAWVCLLLPTPPPHRPGSVTAYNAIILPPVASLSLSALSPLCAVRRCSHFCCGHSCTALPTTAHIPSGVTKAHRCQARRYPEPHGQVVSPL